MFLVDAAGGAGRYAQELVPALLEAEPRLALTVFVNCDAPASLAAAPWAGEVDWVRLPTRFSNRTHLPGQAVALPAIAARRRLDVVHSLANGGPPITPGIRRVVTMLDLIWLHQREDWGSPSAVKTCVSVALAKSSTTSAMTVTAMRRREVFIPSRSPRCSRRRSASRSGAW